MGMFDEIVCDYQLPGTPPEFIKAGHRFQTKDLDCDMSVYNIDEDGMIDASDFTGTIEFYTTNIRGSGPGLYTENGEDAESVDYVAVFVDSKITSLTESGRTREPALKQERQFTPRPPPDAEEIARHEARLSRPMLGKRVYVEYGGIGDRGERGHWSEVVAETEHQLCLKVVDPLKEDHKWIDQLYVESRTFLDHLIFDTKEEADEYNGARQEDWDRRKREYDELVASRTSV